MTQDPPSGTTRGSQQGQTSYWGIGGNLVENMGLERQKGFNTLILVKNDITKCSRELFIQLKNLPLAILGRL